MARMITRQEAATLLNVTPQTISNWVEKGMLKVHNNRNGRNLYTIDSKSIVKLFDKLEDLAIMEKNIDVYKQQLKDELSLLETNIKDTSSANNLFGCGVPKYLLRTVFSCVAEVAGNTVLSEREYKIIDSLISGVPLRDIAMEYGVSKTRIMQIVNKSIQKITSMKKWPEYQQEFEQLNDRNKHLVALLDRQQIQIAELEKKIGILSKIEEKSSDMFFYSKPHIEEVLDRKIIDSNLSARTFHCLRYADIETVRDIVQHNESYFLKIRNFGKKSLKELEEYVESLGLTFSMDLSSFTKADE